jgi:hypothetical protein
MYKVRIKKDAKIFQDFIFDRWPNCLPPLSEYKNEKWQPITKYPDAIFNATKEDRYWNCYREGYGKGNDYGNGSIFVYFDTEDCVEIISEKKEN